MMKKQLRQRTNFATVNVNVTVNVVVKTVQIAQKVNVLVLQH